MNDQSSCTDGKGLQTLLNLKGIKGLQEKARAKDSLQIHRIIREIGKGEFLID